jgi:hypothetical protein
MNQRKKWGIPSEIPKKQEESEEEYYTDSFESYSSESSKANLISEIHMKLEKVPKHEIDKVLEYVISLSNYNK